MGRLLAAIVIAVFVSLSATDGVCCPDGCTRERGLAAQQRSPSPADGTCLLCLGGLNCAVRQELSPRGIVADRIVPAVVAVPFHASPDPLEQPPRS